MATFNQKFKNSTDFQNQIIDLNNKINSVAKSLRALDKNITSEINRVISGKEEGSLSALMAQRRKVRQLMSKSKI